MLNKFVIWLMLMGSVPATASADVKHHPVITSAPEDMPLKLPQSDPLMQTKLLNDPLSPVVGAENPELKIVTFINYDCIYCRRLDNQLERLLRSYPQVAITYKLISYGPEASTAVTRTALTVWIEQPEKFHAFHHGLMAYEGLPDDIRIYSAFKTAGMKLINYRPDTQNIIEVNKALMRKLHYSGTPVTIIGNYVLEGEVTYEALEKAVNMTLSEAKERIHSASLQENKTRTD